MHLRNIIPAKYVSAGNISERIWRAAVFFLTIIIKHVDTTM